MNDNIKKKSTCLIIIKVKGGVQWLVDTGSSNTIMVRGALKGLCKREMTLQIQVCNYELTTLGGSCRVEGKTEVE